MKILIMLIVFLSFLNAKGYEASYTIGYSHTSMKNLDTNGMGVGFDVGWRIHERNSQYITLGGMVDTDISIGEEKGVDIGLQSGVFGWFIGFNDDDWKFKVGGGYQFVVTNSYTMDGPMIMTSARWDFNKKYGVEIKCKHSSMSVNNIEGREGMYTLGINFVLHN